MATSFSNPIIPGFAPDPSIIPLEKTYFLVNSSFHVVPGLPIYASKNLRQWTQIGNAINCPSQISLHLSLVVKSPIDDDSEVIGATGLLAPTIRYHNGRFFIICTNLSVNKDPKAILQNFHIHTNNIWLSRWSDPIDYDWNGIDPSLFFEDDGRAYIQGQ
ncbi:glycosyl hydrolase [Aspergillus spectabilis]